MEAAFRSFLKKQGVPSKNVEVEEEPGKDLRPSFNKSATPRAAEEGQVSSDNVRVQK